MLAALSLLSLTLIAVRVIRLWGVRGGAASRAAALDRWQSGDRDGALAALAGAQSPADRVTRTAMASAAAGMPRPGVAAEAERLGNAEVAAMAQHLRVLELIAVIAPLLGLLGTVLGMIESFQELELAGGSANAAVLAGGIWQALLTTAAGLLVAIPAAAGAALLSARVEAAAGDIEQAVGRLLAIEDRRSGPAR